MATYYFVETQNGYHNCGHKHRSPITAKKCKDKLLQPTARMRHERIYAAFWWRSVIIAQHNKSGRYLNEDERDQISTFELEQYKSR